MPSHLPPSVQKRLVAALRGVLFTARTGAALTQEQMARRLGVGVLTYGRLERGRMTPSPTTLRRLCRVMCLSLDALLGPECAAAVVGATRPPRRRPRAASAPTRPAPARPLAATDSAWSLLAAAPRTEALPLLLMRRGTPLALVVDVG